ncbi:hypothetical protein [Sphingomonas sp. Leaf21]|jgi:hypothetical protein|uniref:hypothetical protein n=1 Tax=Sphingomonas sp. Leaf21 TaxID=2876550 RepID=UPI001E5486F3|nr:hypothetical protein [Sphingomonas sp. Leaf21]
MARFAALAELTNVRAGLQPVRLVGSSLMKGHEDGGLECLWNGRKLFHTEA